MFLRIILFFLGAIFMLIGNFYIAIYINLFSLGYTIIEYLEYIFTRYECYFTVVGIILIIVSVYLKGDK